FSFTYHICLRFYLFYSTSTLTTVIYTLFLHDALPICNVYNHFIRTSYNGCIALTLRENDYSFAICILKILYFIIYYIRIWLLKRSEEHTSELQSCGHLVCRHLLEIKIVIHHLYH